VLAGIFTVVLRKLLHLDLWLAVLAAVGGILLVCVSGRTPGQISPMFGPVGIFIDSLNGWQRSRDGQCLADIYWAKALADLAADRPVTRLSDGVLCGTVRAPELQLLPSPSRKVF
jgi:hypothetical protein